MNDFNLSTFGFDMYKVPTRDGSIVYEIDTPFLLADEYTLNIFVEQLGNNIHIFDEGCTVFDLRGFGIQLDDGRMKSLSNLLRGYGLAFDGTSIESLAPVDKGHVLFSRYIAAMMSIDTWLRSNIRVKPSKTNLVNQTKTYFKSWTQSNDVIDSPKIQGKYEKIISFDFMINDLYVDSIFPDYNATASFMHKVALAKISHNIKTMVVVDDRADPHKAQREKEIASAVSPAMDFSTLEFNAINGAKFNIERYA